MCTKRQKQKLLSQPITKSNSFWVGVMYVILLGFTVTNTICSIILLFVPLVSSGVQGLEASTSYIYFLQLLPHNPLV
ncbi:MAG: hypothetical protein ACI882_002286 [Reinekea sp.]|jgi:hypothetical protein